MEVCDLIDNYKQCVVCKEPIDIDATICRHCTSYQNKWLRRFNFSLPVVSTLIAVIALLLSIYPVIYKAYATKHSNMSMALINTKGNTLEVYVNNTGTKSAVLDSILISYEDIVPMFLGKNELTLSISTAIKADDEMIINATFNKKIPEMTNLSPLSDIERDKFNNNGEGGYGVLDVFEPNGIYQRSKVTKCSVTLLYKMINEVIKPTESSYNCITSP